jgi:hypothetical protein
VYLVNILVSRVEVSEGGLNVPGISTVVADLNVEVSARVSEQCRDVTEGILEAIDGVASTEHSPCIPVSQ